MASLDMSLMLLWDVEYSSQPQRFLHKNKGEDGLTIGGIYSKYNENNLDFKFVRSILESCDNQITRASKMLFYDDEIQYQIKNIYRNEYWDKCKLDKITNQSIANNIFLYAVVGGTRNAIKTAQKTAGAVVDGVVGNQTLNMINTMDENDFNTQFDLNEIQFFETLVSNKPELKQFLKGWKNRAEYV